MKISKQPTRTATVHIRYATQPLFPSRVQCQRPQGGAESLISGRFTSNHTTMPDITSRSQQSFPVSRNVISRGVPTKYSMHLLELKPEIKIWFLLWPLDQRITMETNMREDYPVFALYFQDTLWLTHTSFPLHLEYFFLPLPYPIPICPSKRPNSSLIPLGNLSEYPRLV